jgi:hypothetical protein
MRTLVQIVLWNVGFAVAFVLLVSNLSHGPAETIGVMLPAIVGIWLVFMGSLYASGRRWVIGYAAVAGALFALQAAILVLLTWISQGFGGRTDHTAIYEFLLLLTLAAGPTMIWWFVRSRLRVGASPET